MSYAIEILSAENFTHSTVHLTTTLLLLKVIWNENSFFFWKRRRAIQKFCLFMCGKMRRIGQHYFANIFFVY